MTKEIFFKKIKGLKGPIESKTGTASYSGFKLDGSTLSFQRDVPKTNWKLDINPLWLVYQSESFINTTTIKKHIGKKNQFAFYCHFNGHWMH